MRLAFCRSRTIGSWLIRLVTWSNWSHVAIVDEDEVIEAVWPRVRVARLADLLASHDACVIVEFHTGLEREIIEAARSQVGKPYDLLGVLGLWWHRNWQDDDAWWCSELPAWAADKVGVPFFRPDSVHRIRPDHWWMLAPGRRGGS